MKMPIRVGIVGANSKRGWARDAHLPALRHLARTFMISAISARNQDNAEEAASAFGAGEAFGNSFDLVRSADVDLAAVTAKAPSIERST